MHKLMQLKDELMEELESYAGEPKTVENAMHIKCLASAIDHICNFCEESEEEESSSRRSMRGRSYYSERSYDNGNSGRRAYDDGMRRGDVERGRAWADGSDDETMRKLEEIKRTSDDSTRRVIDKAIRELRG